MTTDDVLSAALEYAARGWPIFPARADKTPYTAQGVLEATTNPDKIEEWWRRWPDANVALDVGGAGMMVLDLDPGHDIKELEANVGKLPETHLVASTPRGGKHLFFALSHGEHVAPSASKLAANVDVRSFHSYVLLAPSHTDAGEYTWEATGKPAHRTDKLYRVANTGREKHRDRDNWTIEPDLPENIEVARRWLRDEAELAVEGQGGDHCAYATAAMMKSYGLSEDCGFDLMLEEWNPRCTPPWGEDQLEHLRAKVEHAYAYNTSPPGNMTEAYRRAHVRGLFKPAREPVRAEAHETLGGGFRFTDRAGMDKIPPPSWLVPDLLLRDTYALLFGPWSTYKTFVALDVALSVAAGWPQRANWQPTQQGPVLFAAGEGRAGLTQRVAAWEAVHFGGRQVPDFVLVDPVPGIQVTEDELEGFIDEALRRHSDGYRLMVVDTVGRAMAGTDENAQKDASQFSALVARLRADLGCSVLAIHHSGKGEKANPRGSSVFGADADTMIRVERSEGSDYVTLHMAKQKDAPEWAEPRVIGTEKVGGEGERGTLVMVPPSVEQTAQKERAKKKGKQQAETNAAVLLTLDKAIRTIMSQFPGKAWTDVQLAETLAMREDVGVDSKTLRNTHLRTVRETSGTFANRAYDPLRAASAGRWRWPKKEKAPAD